MLLSTARKLSTKGCPYVLLLHVCSLLFVFPSIINCKNFKNNEGAEVIQIPDGKLRGTHLRDLNGEKFHAFLSIPFGKSTAGNLRFKAPQAVDPWKGIKDATKQGDPNIQKPLFATNNELLIGSEDCLNLHVFTKKLPSEEQRLKPVLFWIHGGGFSRGSQDINFYGPTYLMTEEIVVVSINYRVGLFGFLSLKDTSLEVPGNAGLKDQVLALKWVRKNIQHFNGDPNNVTIFGISAGAASVELLMLSPTTNKLFHKAIAMSGSALNPWARNSFFDPIDFGKFLGHPNLSEKGLLKVLTQMNATDIYRAQANYAKECSRQEFGFITPVIEKPNPSAFLDKHPMEIIQSGKYNKVPLIMGYCSNEGILSDKIRQAQNLAPSIEDFIFNNWLPSDTDFTDTKKVKTMVEKLKKFYNTEEYKNNQTMISDAMFVIGVLTSAINYAKVSKYPVYLYRFSFVGELNTMKSIKKNVVATRVMHADNLGYIFKISSAPLSFGNSEKRMIHCLVTLWTNFAKFGNPTPKGNDLNIEWKPIQGTIVNFLNIDGELIPGVNPESDRLMLWKEIFQMNPITSKL